MVQEDNWGGLHPFPGSPQRQECPGAGVPLGELCAHSRTCTEQLGEAVWSSWGLLCLRNIWIEAAAKSWKQGRKTGEAEDGGSLMLEWGARTEVGRTLTHSSSCPSAHWTEGRKLPRTSACCWFCSQLSVGHGAVPLHGPGPKTPRAGLAQGLGMHSRSKLPLLPSPAPAPSLAASDLLPSASDCPNQQF